MHSFLQLCLLIATLRSHRATATPLVDAQRQEVASDVYSPLSSRTPFNVTIIDHLGNDASTHFTVHHQSSSGAVPKNELYKRATSRAILTCRSPQDEARFSKCSERGGGTSNGVTIFCRTPMRQNYWKSDTCLPHEICVQSVLPSTDEGNNKPTAYCVSTSNFVDLAMNSRTHATTPEAVDMTVPLDMADGTHHFEAVVTNSDSRILTKGASIHMSPQKKTKFHDVETWRSVGKDVDCVDCVRLDMPVVPVGTERIDVKVALHAGVLGGKLWLVGL